jgi:hypothetical protein
MAGAVSTPRLISMNLSDITRFVSFIEGPYKWHILVGLMILLALFFTRFVFKTVKWILIILVAIFLIALIMRSVGF